MTDEFEQQVSEMLHSRVAELPASFEITQAALTRVRRRRATKLGALTTAIVLAAVGSVAGIARAFDDEPDRIAIATQEPSTVPTIQCAVNALTPTGEPAPTTPPPSTVPREPRGGDPRPVAGFVSYAAIDDPRYTVLGPKGWLCNANTGEGQHKLALSSPSPYVEHAAIYMLDSSLWQDGATLACSAANDPNAIEYLREHMPALLPCEPDRTYTRVDANVTRFRGPVGIIGASWLRLPSSETADDGRISVLTCRPADGLTVAECDAVLDDWITRVRLATDTTAPTVSTTTTTKPVPSGSVPLSGCADSRAEGQYSPGAVFVTPKAGDPTLYPSLASFASDIEDWAFTAVLGPRSWLCRLEHPERGGPIIVFDPASGSSSGNDAPIVRTVARWDQSAGAQVVCSVFDDGDVIDHVTRRFPQHLPCPTPGRSVTRVGSRAATFVDADGTRGAAYYELPPSEQGLNRVVYVLTCRPTGGLSPEQCDTIVADYAARVDAWETPR